MACTPAMAFRLFSSLEEEVGFSAGPEAGIADGQRRRLADYETSKQTFKTNTGLSSPVSNSSSEPCLVYPVMYTQSPSPNALGFVTDVSINNPQSKMPRSPGHGFGPGDCCVDPRDGPGNEVPRRAPGACHAAAPYQLTNLLNTLDPKAFP